VGRTAGKGSSFSWNRALNVDRVHLRLMSSLIAVGSFAHPVQSAHWPTHYVGRA
jgi:hypothetical protein